jgi:pyruvate kinase
VRSAADLEQLRARLAGHGSQARIVAKIEKVEAYQQLDEIIGVTDGVMVARGDYGVEAGVAQVPLMQKDTIRRATQAGKLVITATQMLESMIQSPEPTRAEAADVANAVIDGTSAVMLSAETSVGSYPVEAVRAMAEIASAAERAPEIHGRARSVNGETAAAAVMHAAVELAAEIDAAALVVPTSTGGAARACAKYRARRPIIALAHEQRAANQLTLEWGVFPAPVAVATTVDEMIDGALDAARGVAGLQSGDRVIVTAGRRTGTPGGTNLIMVREIP